METSKGPVTGSHLLVAVGRQVNVDKLDLDAAGVTHDRKGVKVDAGLRSSNRRSMPSGMRRGACSLRM